MRLVPLNFASGLSLLALLFTSSCFDAKGVGEGLGNALSCVFDVGPYVTADSDNGLLRASVECESGSDCVDRRTIYRGASIDFVIEIPEAHLHGAVVVRSEPEGLVELEGFADEPLRCKDGREITGTVLFSGSGEGAVVVESGGEELDRFSVEVEEPSWLDIQFSPSIYDYASLASIELKDAGSLRAVARGPTGDRLIGGPAPQWSIADGDVITFDKDATSASASATSASGSSVIIESVAAGATTVSAALGTLKASVAVEVQDTAAGGAGP